MLGIFRYLKVPLYMKIKFNFTFHVVVMYSSLYEFRNYVSLNKNQNLISSPVVCVHTL